MSWQDDKTWSDRFMPDIKAVLGQHLLGEASREDDAKHATDLVVLHMKDVRIAVRMRRRRYAENEHYVGQFTIRTERRSGVKTELAKVIEGWGEYYFYGFEGQQDGRLGVWHLIDLKEFRLGYMRLLSGCEPGAFPGEQIKNADGGSAGCGFSYEWFAPELVVASGVGIDGASLVAQEAF
jgi:hypothetical protein